MFLDNVKARRLMSDGSYKRKRPPKGEEPFREQIHIYGEAKRALERVRAAHSVAFEPATAPTEKVSSTG
jgi:hypothetical protein